MSEPKCDHPRIHFGKSGRTIFCTSCPAIWRAVDGRENECENDVLGTNVHRVTEDWLKDQRQSEGK